MRRLIFILVVFTYSCASDNNQITNTQGIFDFSEVMSLGDDTIPDDLDPSKILCKGKGLRVAKCISSQLKTGKCLGILKEGNQVYVVEIDCSQVKESPKDSLVQKNL